MRDFGFSLMHDFWLSLLLLLAMEIIISALRQWLEHTHSPKTQRRSKVQKQPLGPRRTRWLGRFKWVFKLTSILNLTWNGHASDGKDGLWIDWESGILSRALIYLKFRGDQPALDLMMRKDSKIVVWSGSYLGSHKRRVAFGWLLDWLGVPVAVWGPRTLILVSSLVVHDISI